MQLSKAIADDTLKEGASINMSLMALGNVFNALSENNGHQLKNSDIIVQKGNILVLLRVFKNVSSKQLQSYLNSKRLYLTAYVL